jgi:putative restriction endonuclease
MGELSADFAHDVEASPALFAQVVRAVLDENFPATLHQDLLEAVGISLEIGELPPSVAAATKRRRDPAFREKVLVAYEYRCGVCGYDGQLLRDAVGLDAAHVRWWAADGPDELANGVALCSLHHKLLDRGAIGFTTDHTVAVSTHFIGRSAMAEDLVLSLVGRAMLPPQAGETRPHVDHIAWHAREVFRSPARRPAS